MAEADGFQDFLTKRRRNFLSDSAAPLLRKLNRPPEGNPFDYHKRSLTAPERSLTVIDRQLHGLLTPAACRRLDSVSSTVALFRQGHPDMVFYTEEDTHGGTILCATISGLTAQLRQTLWRQERPAILISATLAVGEDFRRFKEETGLLTDSRVTESVARSPFDYQRNCLLYLPKIPPRQKAAAYYDELAKEIAALLDAPQGHALALFTSYAAMSAVKERLPDYGLRCPLFTMGRSAIHTTEQFKASPGSVLLGAAPVFDNGLSLFNFAMPEDWKDLDSYAKTRGTAYGVGFESVCREVTGPLQREQLRRLIGFTFQRHPKLNLPEERLTALERHVQKRVRQLMELTPVREKGKSDPNRSGDQKSGAVQAD